MQIQTQMTVTATSPLSDDEIIAELRTEAARRAPPPSFVAGDAVDILDQEQLDACHAMRPIGVVLGVNVETGSVQVLTVHANGHPMALPIRSDRLRPRSG